MSLASIAQSEQELFRLKYSASPSTQSGSKDILQGMGLNIKFPLQASDRSKLVAGLTFESAWSTQYSKFLGDGVQGLSMQLFLNQNLNNNKGFIAFSSVGIYSDFEDISQEDIRYSIGFLYKTKYYTRSKFSYGLVLNKQFFGVLVQPFLDFEFKINEKLKLAGPMPLNTRLLYSVNPKIRLMLFLKPDNGSYRLSKSNNESRYLQIINWSTGLGLDYQFTRHWFFNIRGGYSLNRNLKVYDASQTGVVGILNFDLTGKNRSPYLTHKENSIFAEITLSYNISKE